MTEQLCTTCYLSKPITEFRRRNDSGNRQRQCRVCHNEAERERRAKKRDDYYRRKMASFASDLRNERSARRVDLICGAMLREFNGFDGFVEAWKCLVEDGRQRGGIHLIRVLETIVKLLIVQDQIFERQLRSMSEMELMQLAAQLGEPIEQQ